VKRQGMFVLRCPVRRPPPKKTDHSSNQRAEADRWLVDTSSFQALRRRSAGACRGLYANEQASNTAESVVVIDFVMFVLLVVEFARIPSPCENGILANPTVVLTL
jgi:hypothetical protein